MPWVRLDDSFADHPKIERAGPLAAWLHVAALCYCARQLTDGRIPQAKALRLTDIPQPEEHVSALLRVGLWIEDGDDYVLHDYLDYQPSRADVEAERSAARERMAKKRRRQDGTFARTSGEVRPNNSRSSPEVRPPRSSPTPSRPDPSNTYNSSSSDLRACPQPVDDDVPAEVWTHVAELKLALEPAGSVRSPTPWKHKCATNARTELAEQAGRWWHMFDLTPYRLAQALVDGQAPRNIARRQEPA